MNCDMGGLKSMRDAMSFRAHEGFWEELNRKFNEEMGKHTLVYEIFQVFRISKYKYLNSKKILIHELSQHDEEHFNILEQVFGKGYKGFNAMVKGNHSQHNITKHEAFLVLVVMSK